MSSESSLRKVEVILRIKPSPQSAFVTEAREGSYVIKETKGSSATQRSWVLENVHEGNNHQLFLRLNDLIKAAVDGAPITILTQGGTGSGKTHTLEGSTKQSGARQPREEGLIALIIAALFRDGASSVKGEIWETARGKDMELVPATLHQDANSAIQWARSGMGKRSTKTRSGSCSAAGGQSSRSFASLLLTTNKGGSVHIYGSEIAAQTDSRTINLHYKQLQEELVGLVKAGARGRRNKLPTTVDQVKKRINHILERVWCSQHTILLGCVDPTPGDDQVRAVSTMNALSSVADARLPALIPDRSVDSAPAPHSDEVVLAHDGAEATGALPQTVQQVALLPHHIQLPVIDDEFKQLLAEVAKVAELRVSEAIPNLSDRGWSFNDRRTRMQEHRDLSDELANMIAANQHHLEGLEKLEAEALHRREQALMLLILTEVEREPLERRIDRLQQTVSTKIERVTSRVKSRYTEFYETLPDHAGKLRGVLLKLAHDAVDARAESAKNRLTIFQQAMEVQYITAAATKSKERALAQAEGALFRLERKTREWAALASQHEALQAECDKLRDALQAPSSQHPQLSQTTRSTVSAPSLTFKPRTAEIRELARKEGKRVATNSRFKPTVYRDEDPVPLSAPVPAVIRLGKLGILDPKTNTSTTPPSTPPGQSTRPPRIPLAVLHGE